jgi:hypothetical protein
MTEHSSSVEIVLSSDLFDDDPCLESMSVQATAILDAYMTGYGWLDSPTKKDCRGLAAALRAVTKELKYFGITEKNILAIAAELEAQ